MYAMFISLDSTEAKTHDELRRRPGLFDKIMVNIPNAQEAGLMVGFSIYLSQRKFLNGELDDYMELGKKMGICEIVQFDAIPTGRLFGEMDILLSEEDRDAIGLP